MLINLPIQAYLQKDFSMAINYNPSLGLVMMGTWMELNGYQVTITDLCYSKMSIQDLQAEIRKENPFLLGISVYTENVDMAISTAKLIKTSFPELKIVTGGPHPTLVPEDLICCEYIDFVIRKEGESTLLELTEAIRTNESAIKYEDILGLVFKKDGQIVKNNLRPAIADLDILPIPKRELVDISRYYEIVSIYTGKGCPAKCIYCAATALSGATYRTRDIDNVFLEIVLLKTCLQDQFIQVFIIDDTFTAIPERVLKFTQLVKKYNPGFRWYCESRIDTITEELIDEMAASNCHMIQYGIESGSQEVLNKIRKGIDLEHAKEVIKYTYEKKILPVLSFMLGHFCDTRETMQETIDFIKEMYTEYKAEIGLAYNTPFPGTWQYTNKDKLGIQLQTNNYRRFSLLEPIVETANFTVNDQRNVWYKTRQYQWRQTKLEILKQELEKNHEK